MLKKCTESFNEMNIVSSIGSIATIFILAVLKWDVRSENV